MKEERKKERKKERKRGKKIIRKGRHEVLFSRSAFFALLPKCFHY